MIYVTHIHLVGGTGHQHIQSMRWWEQASGKTGQIDRAAMVDWIDKGNDVRVRGGGREASVGVVRGNPPYVRTHADGQWSDNLLALPQY